MDVKDFEIGMKHAVREDPDIILVVRCNQQYCFDGDSRRKTGHWCWEQFTRLSAPTTIGRILDLFPEEMHARFAPRLPLI